ncbi:hypothetical protein AHF37_03113 [Paragonimus kellicotti]|nr:hypothetical protein AHF37_03113 [Paragonimus kellicotti]
MAHQIQRHAIWEQMSFWENVFNEHVNNQMRQLYLHFSEQDTQRLSDGPKQTVTVINAVNHELHRSPSADGQQLSRPNAVSSAMQLSNGDRVITVGARRKSLSSIQQSSYTANMSTLEIAAEEMRIGHSRSKEVQTTLESQEESTVYAQILHFINLIVNIRIPISVGAAAAGVYGDPATALERAHSESLGQDRHTSPGDHRYGHVRGGSTRVASALEHIARLEAWLRRFVEKVTDENNLSSSRIASINEKIEGIIEGHLLNLETIYPEVKNIPKAKKPEIASPTLLTNEIAIPIGGYDCVRCQLLVDGRLERTDWQWLDTAGDLSNNSQAGSLSERLSVNSPVETEVEVDAMLRPLLPAQGALFVTNYRIIFTGVPKDPYQSNKVIIRSFPIAALHSIKKLGIMRITTIFPATTSAQPNLHAPAAKSATMLIGKRNRGQQSATNSHGNKRKFGRGSHGDSSLDVGGRRGLVRIDENLDIINVRALTLQLLKLGFDPDEISQDTRDELRGLLLELRYPVALRMGFNRLSISPCIQQTGSEATPMTRERGGSHGSSSSGSYNRRVSDDRKENTVFPRSIPPGSISRTRKLQLKDGSFRTAEGSTGTAPLASLTSESVKIRYSEESAAAILMVLANATPHKYDPRLRSLLINSPGYLDMARFGLSSAAPGFTDHSSLGTRSSVTGSSTVYTGARLVAYNIRYELTKSYPALLVIPQTINQICLTKVSRSYRHGRFPVITWQHPTTGAYLLRGSGFHSKSILGALKQVGSSGPSAQQGTDKDIGSGESGEQPSTHTSTSKEHARYLLALVDMSFSAMAASGAAFKQSPNCFAGNEGIMSTTNVSTIASPASEHAASRERRAGQTTNGLRTSSGKTRSLGRLAGLTLRHHRTIASPSGSMASGLDDDLLSTNSASHLNIRGISPMATGMRTHGTHRLSTMRQRVVSLCVLGEKSMMKTLAKQSNLRSVEFVPVDFACLPTEASKSFAQTSILAAAGLASVPVASQSTGQENDAAGNAPASAQSATTTSSTVTTIHMAVHDSRWLLQLQSLLQLSGAVVDLLDIQGVTVAVCIEDGTDAVTQILRPATNLASLDIWKFYLHEDLATGPVYDLDHFSPSYRKQTNRPYEPILRQGFNNTHVEQVYAVLGLREGEEAIGWQAAWEQAQLELTNYTQIKAVRKRVLRRNQPKHTIGAGISPRTSKSHEISNADRLTITVDYRDGSEPASSSINPAKTVTPRRAISGPLIDSDASKEFSDQTCNHTTVTPKGNASIQLDESKDMISECSDADLSVRGKVSQVINIKLANGEQVIRPESDGKTRRILRPFSDSSGRSIDPQRVTINTLVFEPYSEDEAFHEENGMYIDNEDELSSEYDSSDDCLAARSAALTYHRVATLQRLNNRTIRDVSSDVLSQPSAETGLSSGFGYETDSLASGSVYSSSAAMPAFVPVHATPTEVTASNLMFATPHQFTATNLSMSNARCQYCKNFLLSLGTGRAAARCTNCTYLCHEKCAPFVPKNCRTLPRVAVTSDANRNVDGVTYDSSRLQLSEVTEEEHSLGLQPDRARLGGIMSPKPPWRNSRDVSSRSSAVQIQDKRIGAGDRTVQLPQVQPEQPLPPEIRSDGSPPSHLVNASYYGVLHKMGHRKLLQQWKQRFFVLDTNRHQLRYYDTELDEVPRGRIDLQEVRAVRLVRNFAPHQRRVADCSVFELETNARTYRFAADSVTQANEWIERIQNTIQ